MKNTTNYQKVFSFPIVLYRLGDLRLPFGIPLARVGLMALLIAILFLFRDVVHAIGSLIPGMTLLIYTVLPFWLSGYLVKDIFQGKKLHLFIRDFLVFYFSFVWKKKRIANDQEVMYLDSDSIEFESILIPCKEERDETTNAIKNRTQQSHANEIG